MKKIVLTAFFIFVGVCSYSQVKRKCGFDAVQQKIAQHPDFASYTLKKKLAYNNFSQQKMDTVIRIPVVVHVIHRLASENISTAQINSQIAVLNKDYRKLNSDTSNATGSSIADVKFQFVLARINPSGSPTTGITRTSTTIDNIGISNKYDSLVPAWNNERYLNIWVCDVGQFILGFAYPPNTPGVSPQEDGIVIGSEYFGTVGSVAAPYDLGRTTTHEVAHYFDLLHIWGSDQSPSCSTDDLISDTPNQDSEVYSCVTRTSCGSVDQLSNFLQYVDDACMGNFTLGQKTRMRTALYTQRDSLQYEIGTLVSSITDQNIFAKTKLYPNPTKGTVTLEFPSNFEFHETKIQLFDVTGKVINFKTIRATRGLILYINAAPRGVYFLRVEGEKINYTQKLIKH
jgi:hypothetical protein